MNSCFPESWENNTWLELSEQGDTAPLRLRGWRSWRGEHWRIEFLPACAWFLLLPTRKLRSQLAFYCQGWNDFFFPFQLIFYWILRKVDLHLPPQRRRKRNKYRLFRERVWAEGEPGQSPCCPRHFTELKSPRESRAAWVFAEENTQRANTARLQPRACRLFSPALRTLNRVRALTSCSCVGVCPRNGCSAVARLLVLEN